MFASLTTSESSKLLKTISIFSLGTTYYMFMNAVSGLVAIDIFRMLLILKLIFVIIMNHIKEIYLPIWKWDFMCMRPHFLFSFINVETCNINVIL